MQPITLGELLKNVAVTKRPGAVIDTVTTDSRTAGPGSLFVAIPGERYDGNDFAEQALEQGAEAALVNRPVRADGEQIIVSNSRDALIQIAGNYRDRYNPKVAAVTGSVGKTTTKEMTAAIFEAFGNTLKNKGNLNNEVGLPSTLFEMTEQTELAVLEMGMNALGDISKLTRAVRPRVAAITAIGVSHIELLGSRENILKAKLEIVEGMPEDGVLVINGDDELLMSARSSVPLLTVSYAIDNVDCEVVAKNIMARGTTTEFTIDDRSNGDFPAMIPCAGNHNVMDALAAYTLATRLGLCPLKCAVALADYRPAGMRQRFVDFNDIIVIEDCYNASPDSMLASLETLADLPVEGIRVAVLGDMLELGDMAYEAHQDIGVEAARLGIDILLCIGENMKVCVEAARAAGITSAEHFDNNADLAYYLKRTVARGDAVMFKASRAMELEKVIDMFYGN